MPSGTSLLMYPAQPEPASNLALDDSYFVVRLHEAQVYIDANWLTSLSSVTLSSTIESSFDLGAPVRSLYDVKAIQRNVPCRLGVGVNLTDWLPARATDWVKVTVTYTVTQGRPFGDLADSVSRLGLAAKVGVLRPELAVAAKVSEIAGHMLSAVLREGGKREVFSLTATLNLKDVETHGAGYYAAVGSAIDRAWPSALSLDEHLHLMGSPLNDLSYLVLQVLAIGRRGSEAARDEQWWQVLEAGKYRVLDAYPTTDDERRRMLDDWRLTLAQVRRLSRDQRSCLLREIDEMIRAAQLEVEAALQPAPRAIFTPDSELPEEWQKVLGVRTALELARSARDYQDALEASHRLVEQFKALEKQVER